MRKEFSMNEQLTLAQINEFSKEYLKDKTNEIIENAITQNGLEKACLDQNIIIKNQPIFNIELPDTKRYDQKDNWKCWIYAGLNLIGHNVAQNLNMEVMKLELSNNYLAFFDKLEKSNATYERIIQLENVDLNWIHQEKIIQNCVSEGGYWQYFVSIVNKYGLMPLSYSAQAVESTNNQKIEAIYTEKVKKDIIQLIKLKQKQESIDQLRNKKQEFLQENYILLAKILGKPKEQFDYEYIDKNGVYQRYENMTPLQFKEKFLTLNLEDFIVIGNTPMDNKKYGEVYQKKYTGNVWENQEIKYLNLPMERIKTLTINQLKEGLPVYMGAHILKFRDVKSGVLDKRLYNYRDSLKIDFLTKQEALDLRDIQMHHIMVITGVNLVNNQPQRWKIEDSYGTKEKLDGYYIMNDNFFEDFVLSVVIHKKQLTEEERNLWNKKPIIYNRDEPF